ncbi:thiamine ABC transporter substrate binding subunit [Natribaculum luteum]|uniref:Thiamine ABC transporter substrate binding subunit n=1 Tax=Natribaculum luteum TaxID=1586232 RepID=A0ABD5P5X3_9EURY|nr:thiamine ABC transporter substrate-binding protein [Natribaculum luteum]
MNRRTVLRAAGAGVAGVTLAGCLTRNGDENGTPAEDDGPLRIATYTSMVDGYDPAGPWLKEAFEEEHPDAELEWTVPEDGVNLYVQQAQQDVEVDADLYFGLNVDDLVRVDEELGEGALFQPLDRDRLENAGRVRSDLEFDDPSGRVLPYDTGYISLVYDENEVDEPTTFEDLVDPAYEGTLLAQNAQQSDPGQAFMLWTIDAYGTDGYLEYWRELVDNDVDIRGDWDSAYNAYLEGERPIVVSYSTDQVFAVADDLDLSRHQVAFPNEQGYANPEGMAIFEGAQTDLAYEFVDFVLSSEAQAEIATRNVQFPAIEAEYVDLEDSFTDYAFEPSEAVTFSYDDLRGNLDGWTDEWSREIVGR